jgi:hypothetical protein
MRLVEFASFCPFSYLFTCCLLEVIGYPAVGIAGETKTATATLSGYFSDPWPARGSACRNCGRQGLSPPVAPYSSKDRTSSALPGLSPQLAMSSAMTYGGRRRTPRAVATYT